MTIAILLLAVAMAAPPYTPKLLTPGLTCRAYNAQGFVLSHSTARRCRFLRMVADNHPEWTAAKRSRLRACLTEPDGLVANHIVPEACGGCDVPSNMELMTVAEWKGRTGPERTDCGRHPGGSW